MAGGFASVKQDPESGEFWVRERGTDYYRPSSQAEVDASFEDTGLIGSARRAFETIDRGLGQGIGSPLREALGGRGYTAEEAAANRARLEELGQAGYGASEANPLGSFVGGLAPEAVLLGATAGAGLPATLAGRGALFGVEGAALGAAGSPEAPLRGALLGGGLGLGGGLAGEALAGAGRVVGRGFRRGADRGNAILDQAAARGATAERQAAGMVGELGGSPGSISGLEASEIGQAGRQGWGARLAGVWDRDPDLAFNREAAELGFRLTPGMEHGSKALRQIDSIIESRPGGVAAFAELRQQNEDALNRLMTRALGGEGTDLGPEALDVMRKKLEASFAKIGEQIGEVDLKPTGTALNHLVDGLTDPVVRDWIRKIADEVPTKMQGKELMQRLSKYRRDADTLLSAQGGDRAKGMALDDMADIVERQMLRQAPKSVTKALKTASQRWRLLRTVDRGQIINQEGKVSPNLLNSALRLRYRNEYRYGRGTGDFAIDRLLRGSDVAYRMRDIVGNSGTATRSQNLFDVVTGGQLARGFGKAYLEGMDLEAASRMAAGGALGAATTAGVAGSGLSALGGLLGD